MKFFKTKKFWIIFVLALAVVFVVGGLVLKHQSPHILPGQQELKGEILYNDCSKAGVGCSEYAIRIQSGKYYSLADPKKLLNKDSQGKNVGITGKFIESFYGNEIFEIESVSE